MNFQELNDNATQLFIHGEYQVLLDGWNALPDADRINYPELLFTIGKIFICTGYPARARYVTQLYLELYPEDLEKQARVYIALAQLALNSIDFESVEYFVAQVQQRTQRPELLAECEFMLGRMARGDAPAQALKHYDRAQKLFTRASIANPKALFDVARTAKEFAELAFRQGMRQLGWEALERAEYHALAEGATVVLCSVLIRKGEALTQEGRYLEAISTYERALSLGIHDPYNLEIRVALAQIALSLNDDASAIEILPTPETIQTDYRPALEKYYITLAWLEAYRSDFYAADHALQQLAVIQQGDAYVDGLMWRVRAFVGIQQNQINANMIEALHHSIGFFSQYHMEHEISPSKLLQAWLLVLTGAPIEAMQLVREIEADIVRLGHVEHLMRLYSLSYAYLGEWWTPDIELLFEQAQQKYMMGLQNKVRVYALGVPRVYVNGEALNYKGHRHAGLKLLLYMLERRRAQYEEIVDAIYDNPLQPNTRKRFHTAKWAITNEIPDWMQYVTDLQLYIVRDDFPHYYDAGDFTRQYDMIMHMDTPILTLSQGLRLIQQYRPFARTIDGETFEQWRHEYAARHDMLVQFLEESLSDIENYLSRSWRDYLRRKIREIALE